MNAKTATLTAALALILVGGLVTCSADATEAPESTATATTEVPALAAVGDVVTAEQAEALPAGQRAYEMADGRLVVI